MKNIAADQTEFAFQIERGMDLTPQYRGLETGSPFFNCINHHISDFFTMVVPVTVTRQNRLNMLTEQACDMLTFRGQSDANPYKNRKKSTPSRLRKHLGKAPYKG